MVFGKVMLLDVRPKAAFDTEHLSCAVHFYPSCLQRFALLSAGLRQPKTERLAAALYLGKLVNFAAKVWIYPPRMPVANEGFRLGLPN